MSFDYNHVVLMGRTVKKPESLSISDSIKVFFPLAVRRQYRKEDGTYDTDFVNVVAWGKLAEVCSQYLNKGSQVLIDGRIQVRNYEKNKETKWITEIIAENIKFLSYSNKKNPAPKEN